MWPHTSRPVIIWSSHKSAKTLLSRVFCPKLVLHQIVFFVFFRNSWQWKNKPLPVGWTLVVHWGVTVTTMPQNQWDHCPAVYTQSDFRTLTYTLRRFFKRTCPPSTHTSSLPDVMYPLPASCSLMEAKCLPPPSPLLLISFRRPFQMPLCDNTALSASTQSLI